MAMNDHLLKVCKISEVMCISTGASYLSQGIWYVHDLYKAGAAFNTEEKHDQCQISKDYLAYFVKNTSNFLSLSSQMKFGSTTIH